MASEHKHDQKGSIFSLVHPLARAGYDEVSTGYTIATGKIGASTSPMTSMQLSEVESRLREGMNVVEAGTIETKHFEEIPVEHFREMNRLAKLAGAEITMHAPLVDPSGFSQGRWGGEEARQHAERQLKTIVERSLLANPQGNMPIVIHSAGVDVPANEWAQDEKGKPRLNTIYVVNRETGQMAPMKREEEFDIEKGKMRIFEPQERLDKMQKGQWLEELHTAEKIRFEINELTSRSLSHDKQIKELERLKESGKLQEEGISENEFQKAKQEAERNREYNNSSAKLYAEILQEKIIDMYKKSNKYGTAELKEKTHTMPQIKNLKDAELALKKLGDLTRENSKNKRFYPEIYQPVEEFALEHASETLSNVALEARKIAKRDKAKAPVIAVENVWPHIAFSRGETLRDLIQETRKKVAQNLSKGGMSWDDAKIEAEKMVGATWDIGHINNLRKYGYGEEDIKKDTEKIAKYVKHFHMHDNFGNEDSHLPLGMGNAPLNKILKTLKDEGYDGKAIIEGGAFAAAFKTSPQPYSLQKLDSPIYYPGTTGMSGAGWGSLPEAQQYFSGYGNILPEQHFSMYGGGFSQLPTELGGRAGGKGGRFAGTPTE